jgi:inosine/xanthosine triphosphatase
MKTVIVASKNPVKIFAVHQGLERMFSEETFSIQGISVPSGVSNQPLSSKETMQGALNRAKAAREQVPTADYWIGIEGGVDSELEGEFTRCELCAFAWVVVLGKDQMGKGRTGTFTLPPRISELIHQGKELGEADDIVFGRTNSKQENGAVGLLTGDTIDRAAFYIHAVILALIPFLNPDLYLRQTLE